MRYLRLFWEGFREGFYQEAQRLMPLIVWSNFLILCYIVYLVRKL